LRVACWTTGTNCAGWRAMRRKAGSWRPFGVEPVTGGLDDAAILAAEARRADAVINCASSDHRGAVEAVLEALAGSNKPFSSHQRLQHRGRRGPWRRRLGQDP
jgi:hypothetical protein